MKKSFYGVPTPFYKGFTVIPDWMFSLNLSLTAVCCYAVIYGLSRNAKNFIGNSHTLSSRLGISEDEVDSALNELLERELIIANDYGHPSELIEFQAILLTSDIKPNKKPLVGFIEPF